MFEPRGGPPRQIVLNAGNREYTSEFETVADFEGDGATGANVSYGNTPGTSGAVFNRPRPDENEGDITAIVNQRGG